MHLGQRREIRVDPEHPDDLTVVVADEKCGRFEEFTAAPGLAEVVRDVILAFVPTVAKNVRREIRHRRSDLAAGKMPVANRNEGVRAVANVVQNDLAVGPGDFRQKIDEREIGTHFLLGFFLHVR